MSLRINEPNESSASYTELNESDLSTSCALMNCSFKVFKVLETSSHLAAGLCATVGMLTLEAAAPTASVAANYSLQTPLEASKQMGIIGGFCLAGAASLALISKVMQKSAQCFDTRPKAEIAAASTKWNLNTFGFSAGLAAFTSVTAFFAGSVGVVPGVLMLPALYLGVCSDDCLPTVTGFISAGLPLYGVAIATMPLCVVAAVCRDYFGK